MTEEQAESTFQAHQIDRRGTVRVAALPDGAMSLFTPEGEKLWVPDWEPTYFYPANGELIEGLTWSTEEEDGETTLWAVVRVDHTAREVEYLRVTPGSRMGSVKVRFAGYGDGVTRVEMRYRMTGLSPEGNALLEEFDVEFDGMLEEWEDQISEHLGRTP